MMKGPQVQFSFGSRVYSMMRNSFLSQRNFHSHVMRNGGRRDRCVDVSVRIFVDITVISCNHFALMRKCFAIFVTCGGCLNHCQMFILPASQYRFW